MDISPLEPPVDFKSTSKHGTTRAALRSITKYLRSFGKSKGFVSSRAAVCGTREIPLDKEINSHEFSAANGINRIKSAICHTEDTGRVNETVMTQLDKAINFQQSDHIVDARRKLQGVFETVRNLRPRFFSNPTKDGLRVLQRGKELFLEKGVCCSLKHGTLLLDSITSGAQFYSSLLNVIGTFAEVISEFKMAKEIFSLLIDFHQRSDLTSRKRDLGAAHNNIGCIFLMLGDLEQAECNFRTSLNYLESAKQRHQQRFPLLEIMSIAVQSNIGRLHQLSRNYSKALEKEEQLVESCKAKEVKELPLQVVFTLLNNLAVLYTTLGKFSKAEQELKWLVSYCYKMSREDCDFLLNFVALHLSEVFLSHGKPKEAEKSFRLDDEIDYAELFGGLHINVRIATVEKLVDVLVLKGKIRFARELLDRGVKTLAQIFGPDHLNVASLLYKQGKILTLAGEVSNAAEKFKCSIKILEEMFGIQHPLLLKCYMSVGELALRAKLEDESYFYFQRAMENIEAIYQVSFVNQLSRTYLEMMSSNNFHQSKMLEDTWKIEGLVAEHGVVLAVLLSRQVVLDGIPPFRRSKTKLKQPLSTSNRDVQCSKEIVSFKYTSDFLQTAQAFLGQGMRKEAAAFLQQARKYSMALDATRGPAYMCIARLYDIVTEKRLGNRETLENKHKKFNCLKELNEVCAKIRNEGSSKRSTEATTTTTTTTTATKTVATSSSTFDDQLNIKLVLIFLILFSIEMKMFDTTFAAYDLYSTISQNEDGFLHVLNGEVQVFASRTSITCNGKTALQDVVVSSTVGLNETDSQRPLPNNELYRSLTFKKNAQTDSYLVAYTSSVILDIEELRALDRKVSRSVQECFQQKCFKTGVEDCATQVVLDLTTTTSDHHNVLLSGSRVELLSLCLLEGAINEIPQGGNISEISTAMCQKTFRLIFEDEQTSYFMFSKNARYLLQQCRSVKISTLSVQHQCLSLTITQPVKARVTLWRKDKSIRQKVQFVQTKRHDMADWTVPRQGCSADLVGDFAVVETLFLPAINILANVYQVPCKTVEYSDEPPDVSNVQCEQSRFLWDGRQPKERYILSLRMEKSETLRKNLNAIILQKLTIISELSSQLREDDIQEGSNDFAAEAHRVNASRFPTSSQSQFEQEVTSSECCIQPSTLIPEANIQSRHSSFEAPNLAGEEKTPETRETYPTLREEDDNLLGRRLFEKDRDSRRSLITELHYEMTVKSNLISQEDGPSDEVTQQVGSRVIDPQSVATCHTASSHNDLTRKDITNSSFEDWTLNPTAELRAPNLMEEQSKPDQKDDEDAVERHLLEKGTQSTGSSIAESKSSKKEKAFPTGNNKINANDYSVEDQGLYEHQQFESPPVPGQSARIAKDEVKQTKHTILEGENHETSSSMEKVEEYTFQRRDEQEGRDGQNEPLINKDFPRTFTIANVTKRDKSGLSFNVYDDTVPNGPIRTSNGMHNSSIDLMPSRYTDVVDGPLNRVGNNLQIQSGLLSENANGMLTSWRQIVEETNCKELHPGTRRNDKFRTPQQSRKDTSLRNPQLAFLGGDVLVDGGTTDSIRKEDKMVNGPALTDEAFTTCQDGTEGNCANEMKPFPSDAARDAVDGLVYSLKSEDPRGFGGAEEEVFPIGNTKFHGNEDSVEDQGLYGNHKFESSPVPGQGAKMAKDEVKQSFIGTAMHDSKTQISTENVTLDNQYRSNYLSSTYGQTQHQQDVIERETKCTILERENHETTSPMEIGEGYIFQRRDERESRGGQNEPLVSKDFSQVFTIANLTNRENSRSPFNVHDDTVPDGPIKTSNGMHNSSIDLIPSRYTDVVHGPLNRVGNNLQIQSGLLSENAKGMLTSWRQIVEETNCKELHPGTRKNDKLRASQQSIKDTSLRNPQLAFLGGDVLVDSGATDSLRKKYRMVNGPALTVEAFTTCHDGTDTICENEMKPFPSNAARDAVDGLVYSLKSEDPLGLGGARPEQISQNSTRRNSSTKTKITEPISTYQHNETGEIGLKPGFLARHTVKSNEAVLDLPPQDGWNESNFSAQSCKNITYGDNLQLPGEGINPPSYRSISSRQGLYAQAAFGARTSTQGTTQSPAIHQEPSLNQKESWHFPPPESPNGEQSLCLSPQKASQSENVFISNDKALFSSHGSRSAYDEMDSMSDEYQNSMGNVDNTMVKSAATSCGNYSSTKDSTSSLLGSLQQMMSKTVNLIASSNVVAKQPKKESKEAVKLSIQEEARASRGQEQAVRIRVEDLRNQDESPQDNGETERQPTLTPVQETPRPVCSHYQRRCLVRFPCCGKFYPCHRCHNESKDCSDDQARASNATHIRCSICYHEQVIDEQSQNCGGCKSKMSEYFCATCKHFTSVDKNPFHCDKCGICRIHRDRSFHCDVCNVCLDKRLQGKHKCRPDSGHDECCICLEDAFSGCQILPCSHKVHKDCAIAMIQNGVRSCPICRHPLFSQLQNSPQ